jgi:hypothetical protein
MRYSNTNEFEHKTILPPPFNIFEYMIRSILGIYKFILFIKKKKVVRNTNFGINNLLYINF